MEFSSEKTVLLNLYINSEQISFSGLQFASRIPFIDSSVNKNQILQNYCLLINRLIARELLSKHNKAQLFNYVDRMCSSLSSRINRKCVNGGLTD